MLYLLLHPFANTVYAKKMLVNAKSISELYFPGTNHFIPWSKFEEIKKVLLGLNDSVHMKQ